MIPMSPEQKQQTMLKKLEKKQTWNKCPEKNGQVQWVRLAEGIGAGAAAGAARN